METPGPTVICAWCRRTIRHGTPLVSHGICARCMLNFRRKQSTALGRAQQRYRSRARNRPARQPD